MEFKIKNRKHTQPAQAEDTKEARAVKENAPLPVKKEETGHDGIEEKKAQAAEGAKEELTPSPEAEITQLKDHLLRTMADFDNFRKRTLRERGEIYRRANEDLMRELLPVLDHIDLALQAVDAAGIQDAYVDGFKLVAEQMAGALKKFGLLSFEVAGQKFDPEKHEAVSYLASAGIPPDTVVAEVRKGYMFGDRLFRAPRVVVSSAASGDTTSSDKDREIPTGRGN